MKQLISASDANDQIDAYGTAILEPRVNNMQLNFFGEGEYSLTSDSDSLDLTGAFSVECWITVGDTDDEILSKGELGNYTMDVTAGRVRFFGYESGSARGAISATPLVSIGETYQAVGTFDGVSAWKIYLNGSVEYSIVLAASLDSTTDALTIGKRGTAFAKGKIGSTKIYNTALTAAQVLQNYESQKSKYGL